MAPLARRRSQAIISGMSWRNDKTQNKRPASETSKQRPSVSSILTGIAALATIVTSVKDWTKNSPLTNGVLFASVLALVVSIVYSKIRMGFRRLIGRCQQRRFVQQWQSKFDELRLLERLKEFENPRYTLSIIHMVESPGSYEGISNQSFNPVYLSKWLYCFDRRPHIPTSDIRSFIAWCEEFTIIVDRFCQDYVLKGQERLESGPTLSKDGLDSFEQFRDAFNFYMKQAEEWSLGLEKGRREVAASDPSRDLTLYSLYSLSYRVKSLGQNSAAQVPLQTQTRH